MPGAGRLNVCRREGGKFRGFSQGLEGRSWSQIVQNLTTSAREREQKVSKTIDVERREELEVERGTILQNSPGRKGQVVLSTVTVGNPTPEKKKNSRKAEKRTTERRTSRGETKKGGGKAIEL